MADSTQVIGVSRFGKPSVHEGLRGVETTGAGPTFDLVEVYRTFALQATTGCSTAINVQLEGKLFEGGPWQTGLLSPAYTSTDGAIQVETLTTPVRWVRLRAVGMSTGGLPATVGFGVIPG